MIKRHKEGEEIKVGQYVNFESIFSHGMCGRAARVTKISGKRVYFMDRYEEVEEFKLSKSVAFVCDTKAESDFLFDCSQDQMKAIIMMERNVKEAIVERIATYGKDAA